MTQTSPQSIEVGTGEQRRTLACLVESGRAPGLVWLPGFNSDMVSTKATALAEWARGQGRAMTRFDYSGHGQSGGTLADGTIGQWLDDAAAVFARLTRGPQILVGSSMGGYIALLLLRRLIAESPAEAERIRGLLLIAPAWDMTDALIWKELPTSAKEAIARDGVWHRPSQYGDPYPISRALIEEGRHHLIGGATWNPGRPVHIVHGLLDPDVPWEHSLELDSRLSGGWTRVTAVPDGEHRLSRPEDLALILGILEGLVAQT